MRRVLAAVLGVALLLVLFPDESSAQTALHYGLKGGVDVSKLRGDFFDPSLSDVSFEHQVGFVFGGFFTWQFNDVVALQPEFLWVRKTSEAEASLPEIGFSQIIRPTLDYLEVPLLIRFSPHTEGSIDPILYAGPNLGFNLSAALTTIVDGEEDVQDISNQIRGLDVGIVVGGGIIFGEGRLRYSTVRYMLEGRLTTGYTDILVDEEAGASAGDFRNSTFAILAGIIY